MKSITKNRLKLLLKNDWHFCVTLCFPQYHAVLRWQRKARTSSRVSHGLFLNATVADHNVISTGRGYEEYPNSMPLYCLSTTL